MITTPENLSDAARRRQPVRAAEVRSPKVRGGAKFVAVAAVTVGTVTAIIQAGLPFLLGAWFGGGGALGNSALVLHGFLSVAWLLTLVTLTVTVLRPSTATRPAYTSSISTKCGVVAATVVAVFSTGVSFVYGSYGALAWVTALIDLASVAMVARSTIGSAPASYPPPHGNRGHIVNQQRP
ncbi:hypothetical protein ACFVJ5_30685 [Nocardia sp. NPDC127606]|uniref:hypothetical protein n=1 Tax=Nocardia sp. NPDC127606 TaxID=3345406 RepID=UPI00363FF2C2